MSAKPFAVFRFDAERFINYNAIAEEARSYGPGTNITIEKTVEKVTDQYADEHFIDGRITVKIYLGPNFSRKRGKA